MDKQNLEKENIETDNRKPFDRTICFSFFGSWFETIEELETPEDLNSSAYVLFKAIANYCLHNLDPDFNNGNHNNTVALNAVWRLIEREADSSIEHRKRWFADEKRTERDQNIIDALAKNENLSVRASAAKLGCSKSTVERVKKKYASEIEERRKLYANNDTADPIENKTIHNNFSPVDDIDDEDDVPF